jgi:mannose-6-phosphate isomerase
VDEKGQHRELHTELALDAIDFKSPHPDKISYEAVDNMTTPLVICEYFTTNLLPLNGKIEKDFADKDTFVIYMCLEGNYKLEWEEGSLDVITGETILVPAMLNNFFLESKNGQAKLLEIYIY